MASRSQRVEALVKSAHRRSLTLLGIEQAAFAASLVFAGSALILFLGTQILDWYWLAILAVLGAAVVAFRLRGHLPTPYRTAQTIDERLSLHDTISTAWHLNRRSELAETFAGRIQLRQAEAIAAGVDTTVAFPVRLQRSWVIALALATVALALFSVRYLVRRDLDFKQSLVPVRLERLVSRIKTSLAGVDRSDRSEPASQDRDAENQQAGRTKNRGARTSDVVGMKNPVAPEAADKSAEGDSLSKTSQGEGKPSNAGKGDESNKSHPDSGAASEAKESPNGGDKNSPQGNPSQASNADQQNDSLMNRMKDAVSSLMSKMKPEEPSRSPQAAARNAAAPDQDQTQAESGQSQSQTSAPQSSQNSAKADSKNPEQGQATEVTQSAQSRSSGSSEHKGGSQSKSGVGKQDGGKDVKSAEELQAMGKLAEIIGKRSKDVSGEMMVEVPSGKQQLQTSYSGKVAQHTDAGGEINRDEIPLVFQQYVREYMERVHRDSNSK